MSEHVDIDNLNMSNLMTQFHTIFKCKTIWVKDPLTTKIKKDGYNKKL